MGSVITHQLTHLHHLHEKWVRFITDRIYKETGTVLTLGTLKDYPIFSEFISAGKAVFNIHYPNSDITGGWGTLLRPGVESDWHHHNAQQLVLVYYPQEQEGELWVNRDEPTIIEPREGLCVLYSGQTWHKIMPNPATTNRISLVLTAARKR
jgi:hypothetical protein